MKAFIRIDYCITCLESTISFDWKTLALLGFRKVQRNNKH